MDVDVDVDVELRVDNLAVLYFHAFFVLLCDPSSVSFVVDDDEDEDDDGESE